VLAGRPGLLPRLTDTVSEVSDEHDRASDTRCPFCGATAQYAGAFCLACELRREEIECQQLRERLFGVVGGPDRILAG
jgi:hypothetical protein